MAFFFFLRREFSLFLVFNKKNEFIESDFVKTLCSGIGGCSRLLQVTQWLSNLYFLTSLNVKFEIGWGLKQQNNCTAHIK